MLILRTAALLTLLAMPDLAYAGFVPASLNCSETLLAGSLYEDEVGSEIVEQLSIFEIPSVIDPDTAFNTVVVRPSRALDGELQLQLSVFKGDKIKISIEQDLQQSDVDSEVLVPADNDQIEAALQAYGYSKLQIDLTQSGLIVCSSTSSFGHGD